MCWLLYCAIYLFAVQEHSLGASAAVATSIELALDMHSACFSSSIVFHSCITVWILHQNQGRKFCPNAAFRLSVVMAAAFSCGRDAYYIHISLSELCWSELFWSDHVTMGPPQSFSLMSRVLLKWNSWLSDFLDSSHLGNLVTSTSPE